MFNYTRIDVRLISFKFSAERKDTNDRAACSTTSIPWRVKLPEEGTNTPKKVRHSTIVVNWTDSLRDEELW